MKKFILSLLTLLVMSTLIACNAKNETKTSQITDPKLNKSVKFKKIIVPYDNIVTLTEDGELYSIIKDEDNNSYITTNLTSNVEDFTCSGSSIVIKKDNNIYYSKGHLDSKLDDPDLEFQLVSNKIKDIFLFYDELAVAVKEDNTTTTYDQNEFYHNNLVSSEASYDFNRLSNVKYVIIDDNYYGYVNTDGELFIKTNSSETFKKKLDHINKYKPSNRLFLTDNNELYAFNDMFDAVKIDDDVVEFTDEYYKTKNGDVFIPNYPAYYSATAFPKNSPLKEDIDAHKYSIKLEVKNVDTVLSSGFDISSVTYTTTDGMLVRNCNGKEQKVKLTINNLTEIYKFNKQDRNEYYKR